MENCLEGRMLRPADIEILRTSGGGKIVPVLVNGVPGGDAFTVGRGGAQNCTTSFSKKAVRGRTRRSTVSSSVASLSGRFLECLAPASVAARPATALSCVAFSRSAMELMVGKLAIPPPKIPACDLAPIGCLRAYRPDMSMLEGDILVCDGAAVPIFLSEADEGRTEWPGFQSGDPDMAQEIEIARRQKHIHEWLGPPN